MKTARAMWVFAGVVLASFLAGAGVHLLHRTRPALVFSTYDMDMGDLDFDTQVRAQFPFRNASTHAITIRDVRADCACTSAKTSATEIPAGGAGTIEVTFRSANTRGPEHHRIAVLTDAPGQEVISLTMSAVVAAGIALVPRVVSFGPVLATSHVEARDVAVVSFFRGTVKIVSITSSSRFIKARLLSDKHGYGREVGRLRIELCNNPPTGKLTGAVVVKTLTEKGEVQHTIDVITDVLERPGTGLWPEVVPLVVGIRLAAG
jgi:hypothetical protein